MRSDGPDGRGPEREDEGGTETRRVCGLHPGKTGRVRSSVGGRGVVRAGARGAHLVPCWALPSSHTPDTVPQPHRPALHKCHHNPAKSSCPGAPLTMAAQVGRGEAAEGVASGHIGVAGHGADHGLQVLFLLQAAGVSLGLAWGGGRAAAGAGGGMGARHSRGRGKVPGEGAFWALKRPTTPLPCRPPERSSTALERPLRQQTTGKRLWR